MTVTENNPHKISQMGTGTSLAAITDASDFPHTGLIKGLSLMARQNIVVKGSNNSATHDFNITQSPSSSGDNSATADVIQVAQGSYLRDGKLYTATAVNFPIGTTVNATSLLIPTHTLGGVAADKGYHLLVINSSNALKIRQPTAANKVPDYTTGDTLIAIIEISSTTVNGTRNIQYLTSDKTSNSVSIAYDVSNTYTETMSIESDSGDTNIIASVADKDINFKGTDGGSAITALQLDMALAGKATFNGAIASGAITSTGVITGTGFTIGSASINETELEIIDGATLSTTELNTLDGVAATLTATELNYVDGVTSAIQTQLDAKVKQGKHTIWVPASAMYANTTAGCSALTQVELSNGPELKVLDFDDGSDEFAQFTVAFPKSWNEGTITFQPFWTISATGTNTVAWALAGVGFGNSDDINTAFGTAVATTALAHSGTNGDMMVSAESTAITISGASVDSVTYFQINRNTATDNHASDARLIGIKIFYTTDAENDA